MTDLERLQKAAGILMQRLVNVTGELVNAQVEAEAQKERADKAEARVAELEQQHGEVK